MRPFLRVIIVTLNTAVFSRSFDVVLDSHILSSILHRIFNKSKNLTVILNRNVFNIIVNIVLRVSLTTSTKLKPFITVYSVFAKYYC